MDQNLNDKYLLPEQLAGAWQLIQKAKKITLLTHKKPDADGISACAALAHMLEKYDKDIEAIYPSPAESDTIQRQPRNVLINKHTIIPDLIIVCDTANYDRMYYPEEFKQIPLINIDHHVSNAIKGNYNFVNPLAASTCDYLFLILKHWDKSCIDKYIAECLLFGMLYDTQVFQTNATQARTLRIAADLMDYGADLYALKTELLCNKNPKIIALWAHVLGSVKITPSGKAAYALVTNADLQELGVTSAGLAGFSNFFAQISGIDVSALFYEIEPGVTSVSLRSKTTDVNALAGKFGGGGHKFAAGITSKKPIHELAQEIMSLL
jgi:bifunctional oligoribonuclease and PAP phosphatase NrnA